MLLDQETCGNTPFIFIFPPLFMCSVKGTIMCRTHPVKANGRDDVCSAEVHAEGRGNLILPGWRRV